MIDIFKFFSQSLNWIRRNEWRYLKTISFLQVSIIIGMWSTNKNNIQTFQENILEILKQMFQNIEKIFEEILTVENLIVLKELIMLGYTCKKINSLHMIKHILYKIHHRSIFLPCKKYFVVERVNSLDNFASHEI